MSTHCVIFDLDGVICDERHRLAYVLADPPDIGAFNAAHVDDTPHKFVTFLARTLSLHLAIMIFTSRTEKHRATTVEQLRRFDVPHAGLFMRADDDRRADEVVKKEMLDTVIADGWHPLFAVEDRPSVVEMWSANKLPCFIVNQENWRDQEYRRGKQHGVMDGLRLAAQTIQDVMSKNG